MGNCPAIFHLRPTSTVTEGLTWPSIVRRTAAGTSASPRRATPTPGGRSISGACPATCRSRPTSTATARPTWPSIARRTAAGTSASPRLATPTPGGRSISGGARRRAARGRLRRRRKDRPGRLSAVGRRVSIPTLSSRHGPERITAYAKKCRSELCRNCVTSTLATKAIFSAGTTRRRTAWVYNGVVGPSGWSPGEIGEFLMATQFTLVGDPAVRHGRR